MKFVEQNKIDLLLVDIRMPQISGFDLIAHTKQHQPDTAVLVMTGFGTVEMAIQALRQGVDGLVLKPFDVGGELVQAVQQALDDNQKKRDIARIQALRPLFDIIESFLAETHPEHLLELVLSAVCGYLRCESCWFLPALCGMETTFPWFPGEVKHCQKKIAILMVALLVVWMHSTRRYGLT